MFEATQSYLRGEHREENCYHLSGDGRQQPHPSILQVEVAMVSGGGQLGTTLSRYFFLTSASARIRAGWEFFPPSFLTKVTTLEFTEAK